MDVLQARVRRGAVVEGPGDGHRRSGGNDAAATVFDTGSGQAGHVRQRVDQGRAGQRHVAGGRSGADLHAIGDRLAGCHGQRCRRILALLAHRVFRGGRIDADRRRLGIAAVGGVGRQGRSRPADHGILWRRRTDETVDAGDRAIDDVGHGDRDVRDDAQVDIERETVATGIAVAHQHQGIAAGGAGDAVEEGRDRTIGHDHFGRERILDAQGAATGDEVVARALQAIGHVRVRIERTGTADPCLGEGLLGQRAAGSQHERDGQDPFDDVVHDLPGIDDGQPGWRAKRRSHAKQIPRQKIRHGSLRLESEEDLLASARTDRTTARACRGPKPGFGLITRCRSQVETGRPTR